MPRSGRNLELGVLLKLRQVRKLQFCVIDCNIPATLLIVQVTVVYSVFCILAGAALENCKTHYNYMSYV